MKNLSASLLLLQNIYFFFFHTVNGSNNNNNKNWVKKYEHGISIKLLLSLPSVDVGAFWWRNWGWFHVDTELSHCNRIVKIALRHALGNIFQRSTHTLTIEIWWNIWWWWSKASMKNLASSILCYKKIWRCEKFIAISVIAGKNLTWSDIFKIFWYYDKRWEGYWKIAI